MSMHFRTIAGGSAPARAVLPRSVFGKMKGGAAS